MKNRRAQIRYALEDLGLFDAVVDICRKRGCTFSQFCSRSRVAPLPQIRGIVYGMLRRTLLWSYPQIGRIVDLDPTVVMYGVHVHAPRSSRIEEQLRRARLRRVEDTVRQLKAQNRRAAA